MALHCFVKVIVKSTEVNNNNINNNNNNNNGDNNDNNNNSYKVSGKCQDFME